MDALAGVRLSMALFDGGTGSDEALAKAREALVKERVE